MNMTKRAGQFIMKGLAAKQLGFAGNGKTVLKFLEFGEVDSHKENNAILDVEIIVTNKFNTYLSVLIV